MCVLLAQLADLMRLAPGEQPSIEKVNAIHQTVLRISTLAVGEGYEH